MHKRVKYQKQKIEEKVQRSKFMVGEAVVSSKYSCYRLDSETNTIVHEKDRVCARKIASLKLGRICSRNTKSLVLSVINLMPISTTWKWRK